MRRNTYAYHVRHRNGWGTGCGPRPTHCHECGAELPKAPDTGASGYGCGGSEPVTDGAMLAECGADKLKKGEFIERAPAICYACCGEHDRRRMLETGKATLYLCQREPGAWVVSNWPSSLVFPVHHKRTGRHNMARRRYDAWFTGPDGKNWHGVQYGDNTQICHCKRVAP
jgi:hypothetical protein